MALVDAAHASSTPSRANRAFLSPVLDFLCLGGGSILFMPILLWIVPDELNAKTLLLAVLLANVINNPHFANSYQIFYRTFRTIVSDPSSDPKLRARYLWAGIGAPMLIAAFFAAVLRWGDARMLGYGANAMGFFVGWHYVKQGYGMLMVDAALRRSFFAESDKKVLLINSYACWIVAWLVANKTVSQQDLSGIAYAMIDVPMGLLWLGCAFLALTTLYSAWIIFRHGRAHLGAIPLNGIAAYVAALYPWLFLRWEPILGVLIPAMHSLQYLVIVWRYQLNVEHAKADSAERPSWLATAKVAPTKATVRFVWFLLVAILMGAAGFWLLPMLLDAVVPYDHAEYGNFLFFFVLIVFINIHHYFIDNAMWRKENPHTLRHLFSHR